MLKQRVKGLLSRNKSDSNTTTISSSSNNDHLHHHQPADHPAVDSPEANVTRAIRLFCESGSNSNGGEEVLHLPVIVEAAESSPTAASNAASQIRTFLSREWSKKPHVQYNAIMLIRILCDNPGPSFTRNFDKHFVHTIKEMLRKSNDPSTIQILRETLDALEVNKASDENLHGLLQMWSKEKGNNASLSNNQFAPYQGGVAVYPPVGHVGGQGGAGGGHRSGQQLPDTVELASRVEEAKNTAKILLQLVSSTPEAELLNNELVKEFNQRCQSAQRSMQSFINCENPTPDYDTMQTLIETNEQLSLATSRYQRATLSARRALGITPTPPPPESHSAFAPPPEQQQQTTSAFGSAPQNLQVPLAPQNHPQQNTSAFNPSGGVYQGYQSPSGPPPNHMQQQQAEENPFIDPSERQEHEQHYTHEQYPPSQQSFNIDSGPILAPRPQLNTHTTSMLENAYSIPPSNHAAEESARSPVSPEESTSPSRPALGAYHQSEITQSYVGRQQSAVNGLTMHGAAVGGGGSDMGLANRGRGY